MEQLFRQEVVDNKKYRLSGVISLVQPPIFKSLALLLLVVVISSVIFLSMGSYTRKETVTGILQPDTGLLKLSALQAGIITELLVHEGEEVKKDQPLFRIKSEKHGIQGFELNQSLINQYQFQINTLKLQLKNQQTKHLLEAKAINDNHSSLTKRSAQLEIQGEIFETRIEINQKILQQVSSLSGTGFISELDLNKQTDNLLSLEQQASAMSSERLAIRNQIEQFKSQISQLPMVQGKENDAITSQLAQVQSQLATIKQQRLSEVRAPADGIVSGLLAKPGKSVNAKQNLLSILPKGSVMQAVIYVPTSAFGFIEQGQETRIRFHAFPYQRFGIYDGQLAQISANVILPEETDIPGLITVPSYRVVVSLNAQHIQAYGRNIPLRSGMKLDADIVIEQRSLIRWLFDPVFSIQGKL
ncbi:HlyD family secretion protein [Colwelliaceae bacterium 6441]